ncbi:TolC family protein [bacterium]|nr:TolC family protein [bacterium]
MMNLFGIKYMVISALISFMFLTANSFAQEYQKQDKDMPKFLTLEKSIDIALENNHGLKAASEKITGAKEKSWETKTLFLPKLKVESSYTHLNESPSLDLEAGVFTPDALSIEVGDDDMYNAQAVVQQPLFTGGKILSLNKQARNNLEATKYNYEEVRQNLILQVKEAYFGILVAQKYKKVCQDAVEQMKAHLETVRGLYNAGTVPNIDLLRTEVQLANVEQALIKAENGVELAKSLFNTILGRNLNSSIEVVDILRVIEQDYSLEQLLKEAQEHRPEIYKMRHNIEMAKAGIGIAQSNYWPQVGLFGNYKYHKGDEPIIKWKEDWMVGVNASVNIWNWGETKAQVGQAKAALRELGHLETQLRDGIALEVKRALLNLEEAKKRIKVSEKAVIQAKESLNSTRIGYRNGRVDNVEVLATQLALTESQTNHLEAIYNCILSQARLEKAIGLPADLSSKALAKEQALAKAEKLGGE